MQNDISVLVVEDEETWSRKLTYDLGQFGFHIVACADCVEDALPAIRANNFDIALLDINLGGKNSGIELGKLINESVKKPFIFITGSINDDILEETASARPSAFLTKPFNPASLYISIQSAIHHFSAARPATPANDVTAGADCFFVKIGNKYARIDWQNVVCLRSERNYTSIITSDDTSYMIRSSLNRTLQYIIPEALKANFIQVNRAEVLNRKYITALIGDEVITAHQSFSITDAFVKSVRQHLNIIS